MTIFGNLYCWWHMKINTNNVIEWSLTSRLWNFFHTIWWSLQSIIISKCLCNTWTLLQVVVWRYPINHVMIVRNRCKNISFDWVSQSSDIFSMQIPPSPLGTWSDYFAASSQEFIAFFMYYKHQKSLYFLKRKKDTSWASCHFFLCFRYLKHSRTWTVQF